MKYFFFGVLILNLLVEGLAAVTLIGSPELQFPEGQVQGVMWARTYGFAAFAIASAVFWAWPIRNNFEAVGTLLGILLTFHVCIFAALAISGEQPQGMVMHAVLTVSLIALFALRSKWCTE